MSNEIMQENTPFVECSAFHRGMSVLEASLRNTEDSEAIISGLLKGAAEFYGASRASVVEADWDLGIGVITYEWCKDGVPAQRDMLQCLPMEKFPRWRKALRANKPVVISDLQRLEKVYPDEAAFFREYGVTTLLAAPLEAFVAANRDCWRHHSPNGLIRDSLPWTIRPVTRMTRFSYSSLPMQWLWSSTKSNSSSPCWQQQKPPNTIRRTSISISLAAWRLSAPKGH